MYIVGVDSMPVYGVGGNTKVRLESKIVEASTEAWLSDIKEVLTRALPSGVNNADDNVNDSDAMPVGRVGNGIELVVSGGIVKVLIETGVGDTKKTLTGALPSRVEDVDDMATSWGLKG